MVGRGEVEGSSASLKTSRWRLQHDTVRSRHLYGPQSCLQPRVAGNERHPGGFASSTIIGLSTRRYHGLLTAATKLPVSRLLLLSNFEETLSLDGQRFDLSANQCPGVIHPQGYEYLKGFWLDSLAARGEAEDQEDRGAALRLLLVLG